MNVFKMLGKNGKRTIEIEFTPLLIKAGTVTHRFALHRLSGLWIVSDPQTGGRVCEVAGSYRGIRVSSRDVGPREAARMAKAHLAEFIEKVTPEGFNQRLAAARAKYPAEA